MFKVSTVPPRRSAVLTVFLGATAINDGTTAEPRRSWRCHCGLCRTSTAVALRLRCDGGISGERAGVWRHINAKINRTLLYNYVCVHMWTVWWGGLVGECVGGGGLGGGYIVERSSFSVYPDSQSRESWFESPSCYCFEAWAFSFTPRRPSSLSCTSGTWLLTAVEMRFIPCINCIVTESFPEKSSCI